MHQCDISVIIPCYNKENYLRECLNSVVHQKTTFSLEIILIDDHSVDSTSKIISEYVEQYTYVKILRPDKNVGAAQARNLGIEEALGRFIAFLDADDVWIENKVQNQLSYMLKQNVAVCCTWYDTINSVGKRLGDYKPSLSSLTYKDLLYENAVGTSTVIYDTKVLGKLFFPLIRKRQDFALWLQLTRKYNIPIYILKKKLVKYRVSVPGSISANKLDCLLFRYYVLRNIEELSPIKCLYFILFSLIKLFIKRLKYNRRYFLKDENP